MTDFGALRLPRTILFGPGQRRALGWATRSLGQRALVCTDARLGGDPEFASLIDGLRSAGVVAHVFDRTEAELPLSCIEDCMSVGGKFGADVVIGIGGGSCMDLAKVVSVLLAHGGRTADYFGEFKVPGPIVPVIAMPTTSGTGSEVTPVAVIDDPSRNMKGGIASPHLIPMVAICDPELTWSCPAGLTAVAGADALTHAIESVTALKRPAEADLAGNHVFVGKNLFSDHHALLAIRLIGKSLRAAVQDSSDANARQDLMLGALHAGIAFGTSGTAAAHALQYPVGHLTHSAHGAGVALLLPYVMEYNRAISISTFVDVALALGLERNDRDDDAMSHAAVDAVEALFRDIGIPGTLNALGVEEDKIDFIAEQAFTAQRLIKNNPRPVDVEGLRRIADAAFHGARKSLDQGGRALETGGVSKPAPVMEAAGLVGN